MSNTRLVFKDGIGFVSLADQMGEPTPVKVVNAARISYKKQIEEFSDKDAKLITYLLLHGHTSPFRHSYYTFHIKLPLFVARQWMKYQVGSTWRSYEANDSEVSLATFDGLYDTDKGCSWNEVSGRYVQLQPEFYIPGKLRANTSHNGQASTTLPLSFPHEDHKLKMMAECEDAYRRYEQRLESGIAKEIARMLLPQNIYTEAYWTVSLEGVIHMLTQRLDPSAQYEIRQYAEAIYRLVKPDLDVMGITREMLV